MVNSSEQVPDGIATYKKLLVILDSLLSKIQPVGSFYHAKIFFELAKAYSTLGNKSEAEQSLLKGKSIL